MKDLSLPPERIIRFGKPEHPAYESTLSSAQFVPVRHVEMGMMIFKPRRDGIYLGTRRLTVCQSPSQVSGRRVNGFDVMRELSGRTLVNSRVLSYIASTAQSHPNLIPELWRGKLIHCLGTIWEPKTYRSAPGRDHSHSMCLLCEPGRWRETTLMSLHHVYEPDEFVLVLEGTDHELYPWSKKLC